MTMKAWEERGGCMRFLGSDENRESKKWKLEPNQQTYKWGLDELGHARERTGPSGKGSGSSSTGAILRTRGRRGHVGAGLSIVVVV